jgi:hypothetical protein
MIMQHNPFPFQTKIAPDPELVKAMTSDLKVGLDFSPAQTQRVVYNGYELNSKTNPSGLTDGEYYTPLSEMVTLTTKQQMTF